MLRSTTISFAEVLDAEAEERMSFLDLDGRGGGGSNDMSASLMGGAEEEEVTISKPLLYYALPRHTPKLHAAASAYPPELHAAPHAAPRRVQRPSRCTACCV